MVWKGKSSLNGRSRGAPILGFPPYRSHSLSSDLPEMAMETQRERERHTYTVYYGLPYLYTSELNNVFQESRPMCQPKILCQQHPSPEFHPFLCEILGMVCCSARCMCTCLAVMLDWSWLKTWPRQLLCFA